MVVDFPAPFGHIYAKISPDGNSKLMLSRISFGFS